MKEHQYVYGGGGHNADSMIIRLQHVFSGIKSTAHPTIGFRLYREVCLLEQLAIQPS